MRFFLIRPWFGCAFPDFWQKVVQNQAITETNKANAIHIIKRGSFSLACWSFVASEAASHQHRIYIYILFSKFYMNKNHEQIKFPCILSHRCFSIQWRFVDTLRLPTFQIQFLFKNERIPNPKRLLAKIESIILFQKCVSMLGLTWLFADHPSVATLCKPESKLTIFMGYFAFAIFGGIFPQATRDFWWYAHHRSLPQGPQSCGRTVRPKRFFAIARRCGEISKMMCLLKKNIQCISILWWHSRM